MHLVLPDYTSVLDCSLSCTTHTLNLLNHQTLCVPVRWSVYRPQGDAKDVGSRRYISGSCATRCTCQMQSWTTCLACQKKTVLCLNAVTDEDGHPLENQDESGRRLCECWWSIFQARVEGPRHHQYENILRYVQKAPDDIRWTIDRTEFDELIASKKDSAPGPDGIPYGAYKCAVGLGSQFLFQRLKYLLEGSTIPDCFAESRTVSIPKTSDIDDNGRIIRSPDALRPLTLCNFEFLTSYFCIETTALAHVACAPQEAGVLLTDFAAGYPSVNHSWIFSVIENSGLPAFPCRFLRSIYRDSITHVEFAGAERGQFLVARGLRQGCPASGFLFAMAFDAIFRWLSKSHLSKGTLATWNSCSLHNALTLTISPLLHPLSEG